MSEPNPDVLSKMVSKDDYWSCHTMALSCLTHTSSIAVWSSSPLLSQAQSIFYCNMQCRKRCHEPLAEHGIDHQRNVLS